MFRKKSTKLTVAVASSPGVAAVPGSHVPVSQEELTLANSEFNVHKITDIQNRFHGGVELLVPGRIFVREGMLVKVCRKGPKPRQFFLFNDILIYGTILPTKGRYAAQHVLDLANMTVTSDCHFMPSVYTAHSTELDVDSENAFQINHMEKSFHVFASSLADKANWIHNLKKYIAKRSAGKQDYTNVAMKAVWVPDDRVNHCMSCEVKFTTFNRKHHCRFCGKVVCKDCSPHRIDVSTMRGAQKPSGKLERVCSECYQLSRADPHKGKSPPTSPRTSPRSSRSKPTVIDSRAGTSPEPASALEQAGFTGEPASSPTEDKRKRPAPARPPPPSSSPPPSLVSHAKERRSRMDSGTFDRPRGGKMDAKSSPPGVGEEVPEDSREDEEDEMEDEDAGDIDGEDTKAERRGGSEDSSSDSDDSAEIDLDDVEEADPFMMQRANSESPLHGSMTDEALGAICKNIQTNIRLSTIDADATDQELRALMEESVADLGKDAEVECSLCKTKCKCGEYGRLNDQFLCAADFCSLVRSSRNVDTSSAMKPATQLSGQPPKPTERQVPVRPARKTDPATTPTDGGQPTKPKPRQRIATQSGDKPEGGAKPDGGIKEAETKQDVDRLLTMTPEDKKNPGATPTPLVTLATDPPGLSSEPLVPLPADDTGASGAAETTSCSTTPAKRHTDRRKKKFKSSKDTADTPSPEPTPTTGGDLAPSQPIAEERQEQEARASPEAAESPSPSRGAAGLEQAASQVEAAASQPSAGAEAGAEASSSSEPAGGEVATADLLDFGEPDGKESGGTPSKGMSRAEKRKNKFKKRDA